MKYITIFIFILLGLTSIAQTNLIIESGYFKVTDNTQIILQNTNFNNNSTFHAGSGTVIVTGDAVAAQSQIGGTSSTTFYNLTINKSPYNAGLGQSISVSNQMTLISGRLLLGNKNLIMGSSATFSGQNQDRYIQTNGTGSLIRQVGNTWTAFPVGNSTFNPARLKNDGTVDNFSVRVRDNFLQNGTTGNAITSNVVPKTWLIEEETVGGSDVSMRLIWRPAHIGSGFDATASQITHYTGGSWQDQSPGIANGDNSYSSDHKYREATNITSFSPFGVKSGASLPVELLYFYAEKEGENVRLEWQTATEINNSHFDVEWSTDGVNFEKIGEVAGAGTTNEVQFYEFLHDLNRVGFQNRHGLYYRLRQVDFDEKFEYTNIVSIEYSTQNIDYRIFPNPASDYLMIENVETGEIIQIFNINGQLVREFNIQSNSHQWNIEDLASGTYFIKIGEEVKKLIITQ